MAGIFAPDCPGCWVFGRGQNHALHKARTAIRDWHGWLAIHDKWVKPPTRIVLEPLEVLRVNYNPAKAGKPEPLFWSEILPVSTEEISHALRLLKYSREDLLELCSELDTNALQWRPHRGPRTIENTLRHIATVEWWYVTRLEIDLPSDFPRDVFDLLGYTRSLAERNLRKLSKERRTRIFQPKKDPSPICNLWTARKVLRRFVDHERLHMSYIEKTLAQHCQTASSENQSQ